jgi:hypothetical protein
MSATLRSLAPLGLLLLTVGGASLDKTAGAADEPPKLAGTWTWSWKDPAGETHRHLLEVEGLGTKLAARERFDELEPVAVRDLRLDGKSIHFTVVRGDRRADYDGIVAKADTINGLVKITTKGETVEYPWTSTLKPSPQP